MFLRESVADKNKEAGPGQTLYVDFELAVFFDWRMIKAGQITTKIRPLKGQLAI